MQIKVHEFSHVIIMQEFRGSTTRCVVTQKAMRTKAGEVELVTRELRIRSLNSDRGVIYGMSGVKNYPVKEASSSTVARGVLNNQNLLCTY